MIEAKIQQNTGCFLPNDWRINRNGRPKGSKNRLTVAKDTLVDLLNYHLDDPIRASQISIEALMRFAANVMPKDVSLTHKPDFTYHSSIPRKTTPTIDTTAKPTIEPSTAIDDMVDNTSPLPATNLIELNDVSDTIASPHAGHSSDKVASSTSVKEKKCDEVERKKEVQPETIPIKSSKIK